MTNLAKLLGLILLGALCAMLVMAANREAGKAVRLCASVILITALLQQMQPVVQALQAFSVRAGLESGTLSLLMRLMAMAYLTEFAAQACRDAGEEGMAQKAALAGKVLLAAQTVPLVSRIGEMAFSLLP